MPCETLNSSELIAISSGLIALLALSVTLWQAYLTRKHNHLSCRPVLDISSHSQTDGRIGLTVSNHGPGPAIVKSIKANFRKVNYDLSSVKDFEKLVQVITKNGVITNKFAAGILTHESVIAPNQEYELLTINQSEGRTAIAQAFGKIAHEIRIDVIYISLYDKEYSTTFDSPVMDCN